MRVGPLSKVIQDEDGDLLIVNGWPLGRNAPKQIAESINAAHRAAVDREVEKGVRYLFRHDHFFTEDESVKMAIEHVRGER